MLTKLPLQTSHLQGGLLRANCAETLPRVLRKSNGISESHNQEKSGMSRSRPSQAAPSNVVGGGSAVAVDEESIAARQMILHHLNESIQEKGPSNYETTQGVDQNQMHISAAAKATGHIPPKRHSCLIYDRGDARNVTSVKSDSMHMPKENPISYQSPDILPDTREGVRKWSSVRCLSPSSSVSSSESDEDSSSAESDQSCEYPSRTLQREMLISYPNGIPIPKLPNSTSPPDFRSVITRTALQHSAESTSMRKLLRPIAPSIVSPSATFSKSLDSMVTSARNSATANKTSMWYHHFRDKELILLKC